MGQLWSPVGPCGTGELEFVLCSGCFVKVYQRNVLNNRAENVWGDKLGEG